MSTELDPAYTDWLINKATAEQFAQHMSQIQHSTQLRGLRKFVTFLHTRFPGIPPVPDEVLREFLEGS